MLEPSPVPAVRAFREAAEGRELVFDALGEFTYTDELGTDRARVLVHRDRLAKSPSSSASLISFGDRVGTRRLR